MSKVESLFLDEIVFERAGEYPDKIAIVHEDDELTYTQLMRRVEALSKGLLIFGVQPGDFVATLISPGLDISIALLAISKVGAVYTPLDPEHPVTQLSERLDDVEAALIIADEINQEKSRELSQTTLLASQLIQDGAISREEIKFPERNIDDPACIFFTSGTTGKAKGVLGSFRSQRNSILEPAKDLGFTSSDIINSMARYAWSISMLELLSPLVVGGTSIIFNRSSALNFEELKSLLKSCTAFHSPPALLKSFSLFIEVNHPDTTDLDRVRFVWYGGDNLSIESIQCVQRAFPNAVVSTAYGCTEIFGLSHCYFYTRDDLPERVLIGKPVGNMIQKLVQSSDSSEEEYSGEIYLGGDRIAMEYWNHPELTESSFFLIDGVKYYATGDYGRLDDSGNLEFVERKDSQVKIRGIRIELGEVEFYLNKNEMVSESVVLVKELSNEEKELHAFVIFKDGSKNKVEALRSELKKEVPDYLLPAFIHELEKFPFTENFKIDRKVLLNLEVPEVKVKTSIEDRLAKRIAEVWEKAAKVTPVDMEDNFFDIGGNSLSAALLADNLGREFELSIEVADIYREPTLIGQVQELIEKGLKSTRDMSETHEEYATQGQVGLIFRELFEKKQASITCTRYILSNDKFQTSMVRDALSRLTERFSTLKTNFILQKGKFILEEKEAIELEDFVIERAEGQWVLEHGKKNELIKHEYKFDTRAEILIKAIISELESGEEVLQLTVHHVAADDNSMARIAYDFVVIYHALKEGATPDLPLLSEKYSVFAEDQRLRLENGEYSEQALSIGQRLFDHYEKYSGQNNLIPVLEKNSGEPILLDVEYDFSSCTFVDLVAALSWSINDSFGKSDQVFCAHVALKRNSIYQPKVGMYVNLVPVFITVNSEAGFIAHLQATQRAFDEAMSRSNVPFELVLTQIDALRRLGGFPFDAFVNELDFSEPLPDGFSMISVPQSFATDTKEISLTLHRQDGRAVLKFEIPQFEDGQKIIVELSDNVLSFLGKIKQ